MAKQVKKSKDEIATIDCCLITIETALGEFGFSTANKIGVEPQLEEEDAVKLVIKGVLRAQKPKTSTLTGHEVTLTDNVFNPDLVLILQGGTIIFDENFPTVVAGYTPPVSGSADKGQVFKLNAYSAQYDASGQIKQYEKISYPNCVGSPVAFGSEDGAFRAPEYKIISAPKTGEAPYKLGYVKELPALVDTYTLSPLVVTSVAGSVTGKTAISVSPIREEHTNDYYTKTAAATIVLPTYGTALTGYTLWDGVIEITVATGQFIAVVETDSTGKALAGGVTTVVAKA